MASLSSPTNGLQEPSQKEERFPNNCLFDPTSLYLNNDSADVRFVFEVDGQEIVLPAHKIILSARSPVFHAMFFGELKEIGDIKINDASVNGFKQFLALFYLNEVKINGDTVFELTNLANKYDVSEGLEKCEQYLLKYYTDTDGICTHLSFANKFNLNKLQENCKENIQAKAIEVFKSDDFLNTTLDVLRMILRFNDFNCFEIDVFRACINWAENTCNRDGIDSKDQQNLRRVLDDCFYSIPFTAMNIEDFSQVLSSNKTLFTTEEASDIMVHTVTGASTEFTNKFSSNVNNVGTFDWDHGLLSCDRDAFDDKNYVMYINEYTTFSSNERLLFGAFRLFGFNNKRSKHPLMAIISIIRHGDTLHPNRLHEKIRFTHTNAEKGETILFKLEKPLIIKPHMKYTIHVNFSESEKLDLHPNGTILHWICSVADHVQTHYLTSVGTDDIQIKFHQTSDVDNADMQSSIVSAMYFNRL